MKSMIYTPAMRKISMPDSYDQADWEQFFNMLVELDYFSPLHIVLAHCQFLYELAGEILPTPYRSLYYDVGIAMSVDAEFPAYEAAMETGFFTRGFCMMIDEAMGTGKYSASCLEAVFALIDGVKFLPEEYRSKVLTLLQNADTSGDINLIQSTEWWRNHLNEQMEVDPNAPTSILSYFLEEVVGEWCSIFCPLGYEPYRRLGKSLAKNESAFKAAIETGLFASAIPTYFGAALDVVENWMCMDSGIEYILRISKLACFVPYHKRFIAKNLLLDFEGGVQNEQDEESWYQRNRELVDSLPDGALRGY